MLQKTVVLIPAYNASHTILKLINEISTQLPQENIIVVDDGSEDQTYQKAMQTGVVVLKHSQNKGKGEALKTGFRYAIEKGYDHLITLDSDLQHNPAFIKNFLSQAENNNFDIVLGARKMDPKMMPFHRVLTNRLTTTIISIFTGKTIKDSQSGYRLINVEVLKSLKLKSKKYDLESEILLKAAKKGFKIGSIQINTIYTDGKSFISPFADTLRFLLILWRSFWW